MQSPLSKRTTLQNKQIARRKGSRAYPPSSRGSFLRAPCYSYTWYTWCCGSNEVCLKRGGCKSIAPPAHLISYVWLEYCVFLLTQSLPDFGPESVKPDFNFEPLALATCDVFPFDKKRNRFVWIKVLPAMMTSINTVSCSSLNKHWDILFSRKTGEIFFAIRFHKKLGVYWTHKYW